MIPVRHFHRIAWVAVILAFGVIFLGGFTRLNNAGLSCPDWPTCYGKVTWPTTEADIAHANANFERAVEVSKAVWEQVHRHMAATLPSAGTRGTPGPGPAPRRTTASARGRRGGLPKSTRDTANH